MGAFVLNERLRTEYENAVFTNTDLAELGALINIVEENIGEFSSEVTDYITKYDRPLAALYEMKPINLSLVSDNPDFDYNYDKVEDFINAVENRVDDLLHNTKKQEIPAGLEGSDKPGKRTIEGYIEKINIEFAGKHTILAENPENPYPYLICNIKFDNPLGIEERYDGVAFDNYTEAMREFVTRVDGLVSELETARIESGLPFHTLTAAEHCIPDSYKGDYEGKLVIIKPEMLAPEYRSAEHQLGLCTGGFGANAEARGRAVFVKELYSGKEMRFDRTQVAGVADPAKLPEWARNKLAEQSNTNELAINKAAEKSQASATKKPKTLQEKLDNAKKKVAEQNTAKKDERGDKPKKRDERE